MPALRARPPVLCVSRSRRPLLCLPPRFHGPPADDLPAYLVIVIVGHVLVPIILWIEVDYAPSLAFQFGAYLPITALASIALLQPVKGAVVALQWALRMHGFGPHPPDELRA